MITCLPTGLFSWNFRVLLQNGDEGSITFATFREQAEIVISRQTYQVLKNGSLMSGEWNLVLNDQSLAAALKPNPFARRFEINSGSLSFDLGATSILSRSFNFNMGNQRIGTLEPAHIFTRRSTINCDSIIPEHVQLFCFTLAVFLWRRSARNNRT